MGKYKQQGRKMWWTDENDDYGIIMMNIYEYIQLRMLSVDLCSICGNNHTGSCSAQPKYFYWFPENVAKPPTHVQIVGEWHKWQRLDYMEREVDEKGEVYFQIQINIPVGKYQYKYIVDGQWRFDSAAPITEDSFGSFNNVVEIFPRKTYLENLPEQDTKITSSIHVEGLRIVGSWDGWKNEIPMTKTYNSLKGCEENVVYLKLRSNQAYEFKFKLGKQYIIDEKYHTVKNEFGTDNNHIIVYTERINTPPGWRFPKPVSSQPINCKSFAWERILIESDLPYERVEGHSMCHIGEHLYIFGGKKREEFVHTLAKIHIHKFHNITVEEALPNARAFHSMATYGTKIIIYGGHSNTILQDYYSFNTTEGTWQTAPQISGTQPQKREKESCVLYEMLLVFFGGYYCSSDFEYETFFNDIQVLDLEKMHWIPQEAIHVKGQLPKGRFSHAASLVYSDMYVFGGVYSVKEIENHDYNNLSLNDLWKLNLESVSSLRWEKIQPSGKKPKARHGHTMNTVNHSLLIFGGKTNNNQFLNDIVVFDTQKTEWVYPLIGGELPQGRLYHAAAVVGNEYMVVFGGRSSDNTRNKFLHLLKPKDFQPSLDIEEKDEEKGDFHG